MSNSLFPWQQGVWLQLQKMRARLPHAILFLGAKGIGKTVFAAGFAQSLLCEQPQADGHACGACCSCGWFVQYNHPDYRRVRPEILEGDEVGEVERVEAGDSKKSAKAPSKEIKIDQIRALSGFMNISTHRQGQRVVLLYPAEALNTASANSLLKMLEEPPPNTVFLLCSNSLDRLLPTILSRCRKFSMPLPSSVEALTWLREQGLKEVDAKSLLAEQGGAPLTAYAESNSDGRKLIDEFLEHLTRPGIDGALKCAEHLQKTQIVELVAWQQRWLYDLFSLKMSGTIRYYPRYEKALAGLAARVETGALLRALKATGERRAIAENPLSARLFIEEMLLNYAAMFA